MKILTFSTLFPDSTRPSHGVFVENRLRHLVTQSAVQARVVAPVPWFPFAHPRFGSYARYARVPKLEQRHGLTVDHPRYLLLPKVGMTFAPQLLAMAVKPTLRNILAKGYDFDLIDAHYFYPDGVAAAMLGQAFNKPVVITARGTDLNLIPQYALPRRMILWAAAQSAAMITVCQALKDVLVDLGVSSERVTVLRNGVDLEVFRPSEHRAALRMQLGISRPTLLSVGHLIARKGHDLVIRALPSLPEMDLVIAGDGEERARLEALARELKVDERVRFLGSIKHDALRDFYGAADILVLASSREGWANVLLESMACGTPVVASNVWGTPEVVAAPEAGVLMHERTPSALASAVKSLLAAYPDRLSTRRYAEKFSWDATTQGQVDLFTRILNR